MANRSMNKQDGFTLIELIIMITLLGILSVGVMIMMPSQQRLEADGFASVFLQDLRLTQVLSMSENNSYQLVVGANSYQIFLADGVTPFNHPQTSTSPIVYPSGVTVTPANTVIFDAMGSPASPASFSVAGGGSSTTITVTAQTGLIQ